MRRFLVNKRARAPAWRRSSAAGTGYCLRVAADVPDGKEGNHGQHGMSQRQQLPAIGLRRAWLARCMAGVAACVPATLLRKSPRGRRTPRLAMRKSIDAGYRRALSWHGMVCTIPRPATTASAEHSPARFTPPAAETIAI